LLGSDRKRGKSRQVIKKSAKRFRLGQNFLAIKAKASGENDAGENVSAAR